MTMPERVFLRKENGDRGEETLLVSWLPVSGGGCVPYVPESRLLAAEARVREVEKEMSNMAYEYNLLSSQSAREIDALRADREALVPLARYAIKVWETNIASVSLDEALSLEPCITQARAILAREAGE